MVKGVMAHPRENLNKLDLVLNICAVLGIRHVVSVDTFLLPELDLGDAVRHDETVFVRSLCHVFVEGLLGKAAWTAPACRISHQSLSRLGVRRRMATRRLDLKSQPDCRGCVPHQVRDPNGAPHRCVQRNLVNLVERDPDQSKYLIRAQRFLSRDVDHRWSPSEQNWQPRA
jgi:hypothetical protein